MQRANKTPQLPINEEVTFSNLIKNMLDTDSDFLLSEEPGFSIRIQTFPIPLVSVRKDNSRAELNKCPIQNWVGDKIAEDLHRNHIDHLKTRIPVENCDVIRDSNPFYRSGPLWAMYVDRKISSFPLPPKRTTERVQAALSLLESIKTLFGTEDTATFFNQDSFLGFIKVCDDKFRNNFKSMKSDFKKTGLKKRLWYERK
jgi:hypothetical protein